MAAASTLAVAERVRASEHGIGHQHGPGGTDRERIAKSARLRVGRHRHEADLTSTGCLNQLETHLHSVAVGVVHDQLPLANEGVVLRVERKGRRCVWDLLHTYRDVHGAILPDKSPTSQPERASGTPPAALAPG